jgi:hypothetical protein
MNKQEYNLTIGWDTHVQKAKELALSKVRERSDCDCEPIIENLDDRSYRHLGFIHVTIRYSCDGNLALYEYRVRDGVLTLAYD